MGLFRCPKCDSICRTDEEVCHICGYRLKPEQPKVEEPKVEEKPQEEKKESILNQKFTIGSGFSRKSLFNSVSFDKTEEPKKDVIVEEDPFAGFDAKQEETNVEEDPFAKFDAKEEEPKEDIFEAFSKQSSDANSIFNNEPVEPEVVKIEQEETKPIDVEPIVKPIEEAKAEEIKIEEQKPEQPKVEERKAEEKPKPAINPYINNGYKAPTASSKATSASTVGAATTITPKKGEPIWVRQRRERNTKSKKTATTWAVVLFIFFILFLILVSVDKKEVFHSSYLGGNRGYTTEETKGVWVFFSVITGIGFLTALIASIVISTSAMYVREVEGYYVIIEGRSSEYKLIVENRVADRYYSGQGTYGTNNTIKLTGRLPNKKIVVASIFYQNYNRVIKVEVLEGKNTNNDKK